MLNTFIIPIYADGKDYQILVSPFSLHLFNQSKLISGKIEKLYFYNNLRDDNYLTMLKKTGISEKFTSDEFIVHIGQDFGEYYLGSVQIDIEKGTYWDWEGKLSLFPEEQLIILAESAFHSGINCKPVTLLTPTRPSDLNFSLGPLEEDF